MCLQWLKLGLCRPIKNIRFIIGEGRSAGRRCQSPERSGALGRGSEHGAILVLCAAQSCTSGIDRRSRPELETSPGNECEEGSPAEGCTAEPVIQRIWFSVSMFIGMSGVVSSSVCFGDPARIRVKLDRSWIGSVTTSERLFRWKGGVHQASETAQAYGHRE